jgi:prepilin-type N-terminal cleavage/methylation domain-containing protein
LPELLGSTKQGAEWSALTSEKGLSAVSSHSSSSRTAAPGFTLVELLVVIAIIGTLVALLLPAVQAAREAGRRTQCGNQMRQMALAMLNHESSKGFFPSGGIDPWPSIEDYASGGKAFAAPKQGLSWAYQILPFLEQNSVHNLVSSDALPRTMVGLYYCPSRRGPTQNHSTRIETAAGNLSGRWLMDYAALIGSPTRNEVGDGVGPLHHARIRDIAAYEANIANGDICNSILLWGGSISHMSADVTIKYTGTPTRDIFPTEGVIVRSSYFVSDGTGASGNPVVRDLGLPRPTSFRQISDGASNTAVLCEKRIGADLYDGLNPDGSSRIDDDAGWSDGWDYDTMRLAYCRPLADSSEINGGYTPFMTAGAAHTGIFNCTYADGSVHSVNYDVDLELFNQLANKADGLTNN